VDNLTHAVASGLRSIHSTLPAAYNCAVNAVRQKSCGLTVNSLHNCNRLSGVSDQQEPYIWRKRLGSHYSLHYSRQELTAAGPSFARFLTTCLFSCLNQRIWRLFSLRYVHFIIARQAKLQLRERTGWPSILLMVELCMSGQALSMARRSLRAHTMNAFIGRLTCGSSPAETASAPVQRARRRRRTPPDDTAAHNHLLILYNSRQQLVGVQRPFSAEIWLYQRRKVGVESYPYPVMKGQRYINLNFGRPLVQQPPKKGQKWRGSFQLLR